MCLNEEHRSTAFEYTKPGAGSTSNTQGALTMPNFCVKCGSPLSGGPFCVKCGADARSVSPSVQPQLPSVAQPPSLHPVSETSTPAGAKQGMSSLAKLGIAAVVIIFVGGAAGAVGMYYIVHRVSQKIHQAADGILGSNLDANAVSQGEGSGHGRPESGRSAESGTVGDVCRLLSKQDVSKAVGIEIVRTSPRTTAVHTWRRARSRTWPRNT